MKQSGINIWATGDGVRVSPETGRYLEDRVDIFPDYPTGDYRSRNGVWNSAESRVTLHAARNEFVSFQLVVEIDGSVGRASVQLDRLVGPDGVEIGGKDVSLFRTWYVQVQRPSHAYEELSLGPGWYPDALIPAAVGEPIVFDFAQTQISISPTRHNRTVWVDIYVPKDPSAAPAGVYRGTLSASWAGGRQEIEVELKVWDFALPDEIHCRGDIYNTTLKRMDPELELKYYQMARRHRWQPGVAFYRPDLTIRESEVSIDWRSYDARLSKYLDGTAFTEKHGYWGPGHGLPIDHILLPFDCAKGNNRERAWPVPMPEGGPTPEFEAIWTEVGRQVKEHFEAEPDRRRVEKIVFIDGLDESYNEAAYEKMAYYSDLCRRAMGKGWFKFRIDGGYSWEAMDFLHPHVDLWICTTAGFDADKTAHFREKGVEPWFYGQMIYPRGTHAYSGSNTYLDLDLLTCRGVGWAAWKLRAGYCQWEFDWNADVAWTQAINYVNRKVQVNGSALLMYRGDIIGASDPIPSIRLKAHRRGFQDYEYFWLLREAGMEAEADALVNGVIHTTPFGQVNWGNTKIWQNHPEAWDAARIRAGELLQTVSQRQA